MAAGIYDVGDKVRLIAKFTLGKNPAVPTDPSVVTVKVKDPTGTITTYVTADLDNSSTGTWSVDYPIALAGHYFYRYTGTGAVEAAGEGEFFVREPEVTP